MMVRMESRQLEAFVVLATELHFGHTADQLHMAPPTLSELIRRLEIELGTPPVRAHHPTGCHYAGRCGIPSSGEINPR